MIKIGSVLKDRGYGWTYMIIGERYSHGLLIYDCLMLSTSEEDIEMIGQIESWSYPAIKNDEKIL